MLGKSVINIKLNKIRELFKRRYTLMDLGLEIVSYSEKSDGSLKKKSMYIVFKNTQERDLVYSKLLNLVSKNECATAEKNVEYYTA